MCAVLGEVRYSPRATETGPRARYLCIVGCAREGFCRWRYGVDR